MKQWSPSDHLSLTILNEKKRRIRETTMEDIQMKDNLQNGEYLRMVIMNS